LVFIDGCNVALLNVVAIDNGGADLLSAQHGIHDQLTDTDRGEFMSGHYLVMDISMMVLAPGMAAISLYLGETYGSDANGGYNNTLSGGTAGHHEETFYAVLTLFQRCFNSVSMLFQRCFNSVSMLFQRCFNSVSMLFQRGFNVVSTLF